MTSEDRKREAKQEFVEWCQTQFPASPWVAERIFDLVEGRAEPEDVAAELFNANIFNLSLTDAMAISAFLLKAQIFADRLVTMIRARS